MNAKQRWCTVMLGLAATACSFNARGPEDYRDVTQQALSTRGDQLRACYDSALQATPGAAGVVVVSFKVEKDSGKLLNPAVDAAKTTAPEPLQQCVIKALDGLAVDPPDSRDGEATFSWEFKPTA